MDKETFENWVKGGMRVGSLDGFMIVDFDGNLLYNRTTFVTPEYVEKKEFINKKIEGWERFLKW